MTQSRKKEVTTLKPITVTGYIRQDNSIRRIDSLTDVELERFRAAFERAQDDLSALGYTARETFAAVVCDHMCTHHEEKTAYIKAHPDCVIE